MRAWFAPCVLLAALTGVPTLEQERQFTTSPAPDRIALTVYRAPFDNGRQIVMSYVQGFAMITETRTVHLPRERPTLSSLQRPYLPCLVAYAGAR